MSNLSSPPSSSLHPCLLFSGSSLSSLFFYKKDIVKLWNSTVKCYKTTHTNWSTLPLTQSHLLYPGGPISVARLQALIWIKHETITELRKELGLHLNSQWQSRLTRLYSYRIQRLLRMLRPRFCEMEKRNSQCMERNIQYIQWSLDKRRRWQYW